MAQLSRTVSQAEELLRALGNESGEAIDAMRARVSATLRDARERLSGRAGQARTFANNTMSQADAFVHANPWRAVAIGAGIGALLAILMSGSRSPIRRRRRRRLHLSRAPCHRDAHCCDTSGRWSRRAPRRPSVVVQLQRTAVTQGLLFYGIAAVTALSFMTAVIVWIAVAAPPAWRGWALGIVALALLATAVFWRRDRRREDPRVTAA